MDECRVAKGCSRCPELAANRRCIVHGYGMSQARVQQVLLVGEAPGYKGADLTGVPFTRDRSGVRLQQALIALGLSAEIDPRAEHPRLRCFVTNVVRCNPPANRTPSRLEVANCLPYLWQELALVQPEIVVPIGNVAAQVVFLHLLNQPAPPITQAHAQVFPTGGAPPASPQAIVPMRHPARISNAEMASFTATMRSLLEGVGRLPRWSAVAGRPQPTIYTSCAPPGEPA